MSRSASFFFKSSRLSDLPLPRTIAMRAFTNLLLVYTSRGMIVKPFLLRRRRARLSPSSRGGGARALWVVALGCVRRLIGWNGHTHDKCFTTAHHQRAPSSDPFFCEATSLQDRSARAPPHNFQSAQISARLFVFHEGHTSEYNLALTFSPLLRSVVLLVSRIPRT